MKNLRSSKEVKKMLQAMRSMHVFKKRLLQTNPYASFIPNPKLTSVITEPMALTLLRENKILKNLKDYKFKFGHGSDLVAENETETLLIEVKATQGTGFQNFTQKDKNANYLIWLDFGKYITNKKKKTINVYTLKDPGNYFINNDVDLEKLSLPTFIKKAGTNLKKYRCSIWSLNIQ